MRGARTVWRGEGSEQQQQAARSTQPSQLATLWAPTIHGDPFQTAALVVGDGTARRTTLCRVVTAQHPFPLPDRQVSRVDHDYRLPKPRAPGFWPTCLLPWSPTGETAFGARQSQ
jgi:hypothetical protein